jgi:hypothetical protein
LPGFFGWSGFFAIGRIWDESGPHKRAKARRESALVSPCRTTSQAGQCSGAGVSKTRMDRILMDMAALCASQGPVFEPRSSGNDTLHHQARVAVWAVGSHRR